MKVYELKKSNKKDKRYFINMGDHGHHFGAKDGSTYIDHKDKDKKKAWEARHKVNKNWDSQHSAIYHSRKLLWGKPTLKESIKDYEKTHNVKIKLV